MSRYLSRRTNKKINDLLINRIDFFRMKREIFNDIENSRPLEERYGQHKWVISLRRPDNFVGIRNAYVNIRNEHNPLWVNVREKYPLQKVLSIKPGYDLEYKDFVDFKKNQFLPESSFDNIKAVENLDDIEIKGKDLYKYLPGKGFSINSRKALTAASLIFQSSPIRAEYRRTPVQVSIPIL